jgi:hypothetical protein
VFMRTNSNISVSVVEEILQLFTYFYLHREFSISLRKDHDCKVVDPYNARKRYAVRIFLRNCVQEIIV